ncbi:hypothetical protein EVAR_100983_1, partial [Eumeta japonica]
MITAAHGLSQPQKNHQCTVSLWERIEYLMEGRGEWAPELSFTERNTTAEVATS